MSGMRKPGNKHSRGSIELNSQSPEIVGIFCYLGDTLARHLHVAVLQKELGVDEVSP